MFIVNMDKPTNRRAYQMKERARSQDETRARIVATTIMLHDEQGVAATSFVDVAKRAGIGAATVYRHFPTLESLVSACGAHVWEEIAPPVPERAPQIFEGIEEIHTRLERLVDEIDGFYMRGALRLTKASIDRHLVAELDQFLRAVENGISALVSEALKGEAISKTAFQLALALCDFPVWTSMQKIECDVQDRRRVLTKLLSCAVKSQGDRP
jgi:AcrR family transcriptional regulator